MATPLGRNLGPGSTYKLNLPKVGKAPRKSSSLPHVYKPSLVAGSFKNAPTRGGVPTQGAGSSSQSSSIFGSSGDNSLGLGSAASMNPFASFKYPAPLTATQQAAKNYNDAHKGGSGGGIMGLIHGGEGLLGHALDIISRPANAMAVMGSAELSHNHNNFWSFDPSAIPAMAHGFMQGLEGKKRRNFAQDLEQGHMLNGHSWIRAGVGLGMDIAGDPLNLIGGAGVYKDVGEGGFGLLRGLNKIDKAGPEGAAQVAKMADINGGTAGATWLAHSRMIAEKALKDQPATKAITDQIAADQRMNTALETLARSSAKANMNKYLGLRLGIGPGSVTLRTPIKIGRTLAERQAALEAGKLPTKIMAGLANSFKPSYLDPIGHAMGLYTRHTSEDLTRVSSQAVKTALKPFLKGDKAMSVHDMQQALIAAQTHGTVKAGILQEKVLTEALAKRGITGAAADKAKEFVNVYHNIGKHLRSLDALHHVHYEKGAIEDHVYVPRVFEHGKSMEKVPYTKSLLSKAGYATHTQKMPYEAQLQLAKEGGKGRRLIQDPVELMLHRVQKGAIQGAHGILRQSLRDTLARPTMLHNVGNYSKAFAKVNRMKAELEAAQHIVDSHASRVTRGRLMAGQRRATFQASLDHAVAENKKKIADLTEKLHGVQGRGRGTLQSQMNAAKKAQADLQRIVEEAPHQKEYERTVNAAKRGPGGKFRSKADQLSARLAAGQKRSVFQQSLDHAIAQNEQKINDLTVQLSGAQGRARGTLTTSMNAAMKEQAALQRIVEQAPHEARYTQDVTDAGVKAAKTTAQAQKAVDKLGKRLMTAEPKARKAMWDKNAAAFEDGWKKIDSLTVKGAGPNGQHLHYTLPEEVHTGIANIEKAMIDPARMNSLEKSFGKAISTWKLSVTSVNPGYRIRNSISDLWNMYLSGVPIHAIPIYAAKAATETRLARKGEQKLARRQILDATQQQLGRPLTLDEYRKLWLFHGTNADAGMGITRDAALTPSPIGVHLSQDLNVAHHYASRPAERLYHVSPSSNRASIEKNGLLAGGLKRKETGVGVAGERHTWAFADKSIAQKQAEQSWHGTYEPNDIWEINPSGVQFGADPHGYANGLAALSDIPPHQVRRVTEDATPGEGVVAMVHNEDLRKAGGTRNGPLGHSDNPVPVRAVVKPGQEEAAMRKEYQRYRNLGSTKALALTKREKEAMNLIRTAHSQGVMSGQFEGDVSKGVSHLRNGDHNPLRRYGRFMTDANATAENVGRLTHYMYRLDHGYSPGGAADIVRAAHFDYEDLSPFEQRVMKNIAPFYTWTRKNVPYQLRQLAEHPGRVATYGKVANTSQQMSGAKPSDVIGHGLDFHPLAFKLGAGYVDPQVGLSDLYNAFNKPSQELNLINPALADTITVLTGKSFNTGQDLTGPNAAHQAIPAPGWLSSLLQPFGLGETTQRPVNGVAKYGPGVNPWVGQIASQIPLGSYLMSRNPIDEARKGSTPIPGVDPRTLSYLGGLSYTNIDKQQQLAIASMETAAADKAYIKHLRDQGLMTPSSWKPGNSWFDNYLKKYNHRVTQGG